MYLTETKTRIIFAISHSHHRIASIVTNGGLSRAGEITNPEMSPFLRDRDGGGVCHEYIVIGVVFPSPLSLPRGANGSAR